MPIVSAVIPSDATPEPTLAVSLLGKWEWEFDGEIVQGFRTCGKYQAIVTEDWDSDENNPLFWWMIWDTEKDEEIESMTWDSERKGKVINQATRRLRAHAERDPQYNLVARYAIEAEVI